jgi:hypothetical protein
VIKKLLAIAFLVGFGLTAFSTISAAETNYICIVKTNVKYICHASSEQAYQNAIAHQKTDIWFITTTKPISDFATAGVFGTYDVPTEIGAALIAVDTSLGNQLVVGGFRSVDGLD